VRIERERDFKVPHALLHLRPHTSAYVSIRRV
jgi:hypothetical protein